MLGMLAIPSIEVIAMQTEQIPQSKPSEFATVDEVGQRLRVSSDKVMGLVRDGQLKALRLGRKCVRIRLDSVERLING